jgi:hypothetical protein
MHTHAPPPKSKTPRLMVNRGAANRKRVMDPLGAYRSAVGPSTQREGVIES